MLKKLFKKNGNCELCNKHYSREKHRMSNEVDEFMAVEVELLNANSVKV